MKKLYSLLLLICLISLSNLVVAQSCDSLTARAQGFESRCAATGSIKIVASGGSGNYKYKVNGPSNTNFTSADSITGLAAGTYTVVVNDIVNNCTFSLPGVLVTGTYQDPRFILNKIDVSCDNGSNGSIIVGGQLYGRAPFTYTIAAPSPMGIGTSNTSGIFNNLSAGTYYIRLTDSCGGIQTRQVTVDNYSWSLNAYPFTKTSCTEITGHIRASDSRGNISTVSGIPGFQYGVVLAPGDTLWQTTPFFTIQNFAGSSFEVVAKDSCGNIKKGPTAVNLAPQASGTIISNRTCSNFSAAITGVINFIGPRYCLYDSLDNELECNTSGIFHNLTYLSSYCIVAYDSCTDTTIRRCLFVAPPPLYVNNNVAISNKQCNDFTATITGQVGLTNPEYCLTDTLGTPIACNSSGVFPNIPYGSYCISIKDGCRDTLLTRCFQAWRPTPILLPVAPAYNNCSSFGFTLETDSLFNPQFCLYDSNGVVIACNNTGEFDSLSLGNYCVSVYDSCYDTTITRCFSVDEPIIYNDLSSEISNKACNTFTVTATAPSMFKPDYCLYTAADSLLACNTTGIFDDLLYGSYCIRAHNNCPDTTMLHCFTVQKPVPEVDARVETQSENCATFSAAIRGQQNLTRPQYCLYDSASALVQCNTTGIFGRLPYGKYCITIQDNCYDTVINRCFEYYKPAMEIGVFAGKSCANGYAFFVVNDLNAIYPVTVTVLNPDSSLFKTMTFPSPLIIVDSLPGTAAGKFYTIIAEDACGSRDTTTSGAIASSTTHSVRVSGKCPGSNWASGSGDITLRASTNMGSFNVRIISKDNITYGSFLTPNTVVGDDYTFTDLGPGTYVVRTRENNCYTYFYDTVTIRPYIFPNLNNSSAYQCDQGGFSVSAIAANGVGPFTYEIIGSTPANPPIISAPQSSTIFTINNGTAYSLIRLRALDACGNATLGDASILPLASNGIYSSDNCMWYPTTLSVDALYNASYSWYKKDSLNSADSIYLGNTPNYAIPSVTPADTGVYTCYLVVNQGCINRQYNFHMNGDCYSILPVTLKSFSGKQQDAKNLLQWTVSNEQTLDSYVLERQNSAGVFEPKASVKAKNQGGIVQYQWEDKQPLNGRNFYRLKMVGKSGPEQYSQTVLLQNKIYSFSYSIYPNPVQSRMNISLSSAQAKTYDVGLYNMMNQLVWKKNIKGSGNLSVTFDKPASLKPGMYMIRITTDQQEQVTEKLIIL